MVETKVIDQRDKEKKEEKIVNEGRKTIIKIKERIKADSLFNADNWLFGAPVDDDSIHDFAYWYITSKWSWFSKFTAFYLRNNKIAITVFPNNKPNQTYCVINRRYFPDGIALNRVKEIATEELNKLAQEIGNSEVVIKIEYN